MKFGKGLIVGIVIGILLSMGIFYFRKAEEDVLTITKEETEKEEDLTQEEQDTDYEIINVYYDVAKKIIIEGEDRTPTDKKPFILEGTTYVPLRYISEALGKQVKWEGKTGTIYIGTEASQ